MMKQQTRRNRVSGPTWTYKAYEENPETRRATLVNWWSYGDPDATGAHQFTISQKADGIFRCFSMDYSLLAAFNNLPEAKAFIESVASGCKETEAA